MGHKCGKRLLTGVQVLHFGKLHKEDCVELSTTNDWAPVEDVSDETLEALDVQECPVCLE